MISQKAQRFAIAVLRAAAAEQRHEAETVPDETADSHAAGHLCAAQFLDRKADRMQYMLDNQKADRMQYTLDNQRVPYSITAKDGPA